MSDEAYSAFLTRAQKDYSTGPNGEASEPYEKASTIPSATDAHPALKALGQRYYISETDKPFTSVSFEWGKSDLPTKAEFSELVQKAEGVNNGREVEVMEPNKWDPRGEYKDVIGAVAKACDDGPVTVYRLGGAGSRVEYFVLGVNHSNGKLVGVMVMSIES